MNGYEPGALSDDPKALVAALREEFARIQRAMNAPQEFAELRTLHAEPTRVRGGILALADGSDWNPGSGAGLYRRNEANTGWVQVTGSGPAFSAYQNSAQSIASATFAKVQLQAEEFDTASAFDSTTNYRFTPQVAGYYLFTWSAGFGSSVSNVAGLLYKNGTRLKDGGQPGSGFISTGSAFVSMNGSTDYVELYAFQSSGGAVNMLATANQTFLQGVFVRPA